MDQTRLFRTADGSPTLNWQRDDGYAEKMHHSGGALTESLFIYHHALEQAIQRGWGARVLSVGLGLGYNEWIALAEIMRNPLLTDWKIWSFESEQQLKDAFVACLELDDGAPAGDDLAAGDSSNGFLKSVFNEVIVLVAEHFAISSPTLRQFGREALCSGRLQLRGPFPDDCAGIEGVSCVFYDAYSKKMNAHLWDEHSLSGSLGPLLGPSAILSTYAATGSLNRALKMLNFRLQPRAGFLGKRESTLAIREADSNKLSRR